MSELTLTERLERLNQLDSTIPENAREASSRPPVEEDSSLLAKSVRKYFGPPAGYLRYNGKYDNQWLEEHIKEIEEIVTGIPLEIEMLRNQQSVVYKGRREIKSFTYEKTERNHYVVLEFPEGDQLKFEVAGVLVCGSNPQRFVSGTLFDTKKEVLKIPKRGQIEERAQHGNSFYFKNDGYLRLKFADKGH